MSEQLPHGEVRAELRETFAFADSVLSGNDLLALDPDDDSLDPATRFSGPILDLNDTSLTDAEKTFGLSWIEEKLSGKPEVTSVRSRYQSADEQTRVVVFDVPLGQEDDRYYLSVWQTNGEEPSFVLWPEEVYEWQTEEFGFVQLPEEQNPHE